MDNTAMKRDFLKLDLHNALKELFIGAITWNAHPQPKDTHYLRDLGMFTSFVQARALYEFFYKKTVSPLQAGLDASAYHFAASWKPCDHHDLYKNYMGHWTPAQKRIFHLVYGRSDFSGGTAPNESDHLKNQVVAFAKDLKRLTEEFAGCVSEEYRDIVRGALERALKDGEALAEKYNIADPFSKS